MIGRQEAVDHFELVRWARAQAHPDKRHVGTHAQTGEPLPGRPLRPLEGHLLLVLATYANENGIAWPSVKALAEDVGYKVRERERNGRVIFENSHVTKVLADLQDVGLVWSRRRGRGQSAERELLMPSGREDGEATAHVEDGEEQRRRVRDQIAESLEPVAG